MRSRGSLARQDGQPAADVLPGQARRRKAPRSRPSRTRTNAIRSSRTWKSCWRAFAKSCTCAAEVKATWSAIVVARRYRRRDRLPRMGSGGYGIPSIVEPEVIQFQKCDAKFVLHVEKGTVWQRFNEDKFWKNNNCILTHGGGQPPRGVRRMLHRLHNETEAADLLPASITIRGDITSTACIKQGSINLAFESAAEWRSPIAVSSASASLRLRACELVRQRQDLAQRQRSQAGQADRRLSLVCRIRSRGRKKSR